MLSSRLTASCHPSGFPAQKEAGTEYNDSMAPSHRRLAFRRRRRCQRRRRRVHEARVGPDQRHLPQLCEGHLAWDAGTRHYRQRVALAMHPWQIGAWHSPL